MSSEESERVYRVSRGAGVLLTLLVALTAGCATAPAASPTATVPGVPAADAPIGPGDQLYVSIGDSYAAGYQPSANGPGATTSNGFAYQVAADSATAGHPLRLVNFGCSGVTSTALVEDRGCAEAALGPGGRPYDGSSQAQAAEEFLRVHRTQVRLVTVVIGGNDVKPCLLADDGTPRADAAACARDAAAVVRTNLAELLTGVRAAVGDAVTVVGLTYPDVFLGSFVTGGAAGRQVAATSVALFRDDLNPALQAEYAKAGARFLDITADSGAYGSVTDTVDLAPYGSIPRPVAQVCSLTYICDLGDVHPKTEGYRFIADRVLQAMAPT